jgi:hypothetical protein
VNHPRIDGKDGVAGSISAGSSTTKWQATRVLYLACCMPQRAEPLSQKRTSFNRLGLGRRPGDSVHKRLAQHEWSESWRCQQPTLRPRRQWRPAGGQRSTSGPPGPPDWGTFASSAVAPLAVALRWRKGRITLTLPKMLQSPDRDVLLVSALISIVVVLAFTGWGVMAYLMAGLVFAVLFLASAIANRRANHR